MKHDKDLTELKKRIWTEPDFINSKKYGYSLINFMEQHPTGVPDNIIAVLLCIETIEVTGIYNDSLKELRDLFKIDAI